MEDTKILADGEFALDGVHYADIAHQGQMWRVGSIVPAWREALMPLGPTPDEEALAALAGKGICLGQARTPTPSLAVMCGGMGAVWPGMGRELYDNFPAARAAMDHIQAIANWDVLALLDEHDTDIINATRWQIPYLFLVEYAQWAHLCSLGLKPALMCGHSLGELIALCCAGIYAPETAWYILDTRAMHVAEVEAKAPGGVAMMAINTAGDVADIVSDVLRTWPELYVANYNTPRQSILCGPSDAVREARNSLRKRRIAAMTLNVSLSFHSPAMRVLRDLALRRLSALDMRAGDIPVLSVVTTEPYPGEQPHISRQIADLDENPVRWLDTVRTMWDKYQIRHFLELGPQEILCGLVRDIEPNALCVACGRKGKETQGLRQACAQLYALGHLPRSTMLRRATTTPAPEKAATFGAMPQAPDSATPAQPVALRPACPAWPPFWDEAPSRIVLDLLARACKCAASSLRPEMDLRYDLALRSITFPSLLREAGEQLGRTIEFEELVRVVTVGDLVAVLTGHDVARAASPAIPQRIWPQPTLRRLTADGTRALPYDPEGQGLPVKTGDVLAVLAYGLEPQQVADMLASLAPLGLVLALPENVPTAGLVMAGSTCTVWDGDVADIARADGLLCLVAGDAETAFASTVSGLVAKGLRYGACLHILPALPALAGAGAGAGVATPAVPVRRIVIATGGHEPHHHELADILAQEMLRGEAPNTLWAREADLPAAAKVADNPAIVERRYGFPLVWPHTHSPRLPAPPAQQHGVARYGVACGFSAASDPLLASQKRLPVCRALQALLEGGRLFQPWLAVAGFSDVRLAPAPATPPALVREGHVAVEGRPWMLHDGAMTRLVDTRLSVHELGSNGRHLASWSPVASGTLLLARKPLILAPLTDGVTHGLEAGTTLALPAAWETLGIGPEGQLLDELRAIDKNFYTASLRMPPLGIALGGKAGYMFSLLAVEGILQAALATLVLVLSHDAPARAWCPKNIGYALFGEASAGNGPWQIQMRRTWSDALRQRFDATVVNACGNVLVSLCLLEYEPFECW